MRIRGYDVTCDTLADLDALLGNASVDGETLSKAPPKHGDAGERMDSASASAIALLRTLVDKPTGIESTVVSEMLGTRGRGMPGAMTRWARDLRLPEEPLSETRIGSARGYKLKEGALATAREILKRHH